MVALHFEEDERGTRFSMVEDGDGDGVRTRDIDQQIDRVIEALVLLSDLFPRAAIGLATGTPATEAVARSEAVREMSNLSSPCSARREASRVALLASL